MKKLILLFSFVLLHAAPDGNYVFQLESATQAEIDNNMGGTPKVGMMIYNTTDNKIYNYNGTQWVVLTYPAQVIAKTGDYTLQLNDNGSVLTFNSNSNVTLTIPSGFPVGYNISVYQTGAGKVSIVGSGTTILNRLNRFRTSGQDAGVGILSTSSDVYHLTGDLRR